MKNCLLFFYSKVYQEQYNEAMRFVLCTLTTGEILSGKNAWAYLVLNEIIQKKYLENMKKIAGAIWKLLAK